MAYHRNFALQFGPENKPMNSIKNFWNSGLTGKITVIGAGLLLLCCVCSIPILILSPATSFLAPIATVPAPAFATQVEIPTEIILPSNTPEIISNTPELSLTETPQASTPDTGCAFCNLECPASQEGVDFCVADPQLVADQALFEATLKAYCDSKGGDFCKVLVWTDRQYIPSSLPLTDGQLNNEVADYSLNLVTGSDCFILLSAGAVIYQSEACFG
jgi:hypothetical protein